MINVFILKKDIWTQTRTQGEYHVRMKVEI